MLGFVTQQKGRGMILAVVVFILGGQPVASMQANQPFPSVAACEAFLASESMGLAILAQQMTALGHGEVTAQARCLDQRPSA